MVNRIGFILVCLMLAACCFAQKIKTPKINQNSLVRFTENKKQWSSNIAYRAQLDGGALFVEKNGKLTFHFYDKDAYRLRHLGKILSDNLKFHAYSISFIGANAQPQFQAEQQTSDYCNYYIGNDEKSWASNVHNFKKVSISNLYPGITAEYFGKSNAIKYNFVINPGGNPDDIKIRYDGVDKIKLINGELHISTSVKDMIEEKPLVYQVIQGETVIIPSKYVLKNNTVSFKLLDNYNKNEKLIIDPLLVFAAQSGSTADNFGMTATYDEQGNLYSGGTAFNVGYPTTTGAYDISFNNVSSVTSELTDVVITKYDSVGISLKYSTYLGGNEAEIVSSLIVDKFGSLCLYGVTSSTNFPTSTGCYDPTFNGGSFLHFHYNGTKFNNGTDIYVAKFNATGTILQSSTYIGGTDNDGVNHVNHFTNIIVGYTTGGAPIYGPEYYLDSLQNNYGDQYRGEIQTDTTGNIYIISSSRSSDFPTLNAIDNTLGGKQDAVLFKFTSNLSSLYFSTYIGGSSNECGNGIALDDSLNIYITGGTCSPNFNTTPGSYQTTYQGGVADGYLCKIKKGGAYVMHSTYIGTPVYDQSYFVQLDNQQSVYVFGQSLGNMPVTPGVYSNGSSSQFIQKFTPQLNNLSAGTVFGNGTGNINISPSAFSVDCAGNIYVSGWGGNILTGNATNGMAITGNAIQPSTDGFNFYLMVLSPNMVNILYGSYFGGPLSQEHTDGGTSRFDKKGIVYQSVCAGCGGHDDFPVTPGAWPGTPGNPNHNTDNNNCNNGVFKMDMEFNSASASILTSVLGGCAPLTVQFTNTSTSGHPYIWDFGSNDTTSLIFNPIKVFSAPGTYTAAIYVKTSICNNLYDTAHITITVDPVPVSNYSVSIDTCSNLVSFTNQTNPLTTPVYWFINSTLASTAQTFTNTFAAAGSYTVKLLSKSAFGCRDSITKTIIAPVGPISINGPQTKCANTSVNLLATGGSSYSWLPSAGLSNAAIANPVCTATSTTIYTVIITQVSLLLNKICTKTLTTTVNVYPVIKAEFSYTIGACHNDITFTDGSSISPVSWGWNFGDGVGTSTLQTPTYTYSNPQTYSISLTVINSSGCRDSITKVVPLNGFEATTVNASISKCEPDTVQLKATGGTYFKWEPNQSLSSGSVSNPKAFPVATTVYTVTIGNIVGTDTCKTILTTTVAIYPFTYNTSSITISSTSITAGQAGTITLNGFPYTGTLSIVPDVPIKMIDIEHYTFFPKKPGEYIISFTDNNNCRHSLQTFTVVIITDACNESTVFLPTGFTPNGDGANDVLYIRSNFVTDVYLTVYDRWGEKLFETNDVKKGWDGIYKGKQLDQGVYGYYLTFKCNNGQESFKKGNITLMR